MTSLVLVIFFKQHIDFFLIQKLFIKKKVKKRKKNFKKIKKKLKYEYFI